MKTTDDIRHQYQQESELPKKPIGTHYSEWLENTLIESNHQNAKLVEENERLKEVYNDLQQINNMGTEMLRRKESELTQAKERIVEFEESLRYANTQVQEERKEAVELISLIESIESKCKGLEEKQTELNETITGKDKQIELLKERNLMYCDAIYKSLPNDCAHGYGEIKFCPSRLSGDEECKLCAGK